MVDSAKQAAGQAKDKASNLLEQAKGQASSQADQQRETLASGIQSVAQAFQSMSKELRGKQAGPVANYAAEMGQAIGSQVEQVAEYLRGRDMRQIVSETESYARRSPAMFLGGAFVIGLAASRFLKSSQGSASASQESASEANSGHPQLALPPASTPAPEAGRAPRFAASQAAGAESGLASGAATHGTPRPGAGSNPSGEFENSSTPSIYVADGENSCLISRTYPSVSLFPSLQVRPAY